MEQRGPLRVFVTHNPRTSTGTTAGTPRSVQYRRTSAESDEHATFSTTRVDRCSSRRGRDRRRRSTGRSRSSSSSAAGCFPGGASTWHDRRRRSIGRRCTRLPSRPDLRRLDHRDGPRPAPSRWRATSRSRRLEYANRPCSPRAADRATAARPDRPASSDTGRSVRISPIVLAAMGMEVLVHDPFVADPIVRTA